MISEAIGTASLAFKVIDGVLSIIEGYIARMDEKASKAMTAKLLRLARMEIESDVQDRARAAFSARLARDGDGVRAGGQAPGPVGRYRD